MRLALRCLPLFAFLALYGWLCLYVAAGPLYGCAGPRPLPVLNVHDAGPLPYPDAGEVDPCHDSSRPVGLLTPGERRTLCIKTVR